MSWWKGKPFQNKRTNLTTYKKKHDKRQRLAFTLCGMEKIDFQVNRPIYLLPIQLGLLCCNPPPVVSYSCGDRERFIGYNVLVDENEKRRWPGCAINFAQSLAIPSSVPGDL